MWNWLVNLLVATPLPPSSCSCGEARNQKLRQMQKAIETDELPEEVLEADLSYSPAEKLHTEYTAKIFGELGQNYPQIIENKED